jgi:hypothetical protein
VQPFTRSVYGYGLALKAMIKLSGKFGGAAGRVTGVAQRLPQSLAESHALF